MRDGPSRSSTPRLVAGTALALAAVAVVLVLVRGAPAYRLHARFLNAGQLVDGGSVRLAGRIVGHISDIGLTPDGQAEVTLTLDDSGLVPLHQGSRLSIRALSQSGVANRYLELSQGPADAPPISSGSTLTAEQTSSLVSLDAILNSFGPAQRRDLQQLILNASQVYVGSGSRYWNGMLAGLDPALSELDALTGELSGDRTALGELIRTAGTAAAAIASRSPDLMAAVDRTATALTALAAARRPLADAISRAPAVLDQARTTLAHAGAAVTALQPALNQIPPVATPLAGLLQRLSATLPQAAPVIGELRGQLPALEDSLTGLDAIRSASVTGLRSAARALHSALPIVRVIRFYGSDLLIGVFDGLLGVATANYDRWGHYVRAELMQPYQSTISGPLAALISHPLAPSLFSLRTRLLRRCPGGNVPPAPDGSSPWIPDRSICTPSQDVPASVNTP